MSYTNTPLKKEGGQGKKISRIRGEKERRAPLGTIEARIASPGVFACQDEAGKMS